MEDLPIVSNGTISGGGRHFGTFRLRLMERYREGGGTCEPSDCISWNGTGKEEALVPTLVSVLRGDTGKKEALEPTLVSVLRGDTGKKEALEPTLVSVLRGDTGKKEAHEDLPFVSHGSIPGKKRHLC